MKKHNQHITHHGFSLIEVLVTLLVLSIGLLGLAGLQGRSLMNTNESFARSTVTNLSNDIINRMTANRTSAIITNTGANPYHTNIAGAKSSDENDCDAIATCTPAQLAAFDLNTWDNALADQLENGEGVVCFDSTPNDLDASPDDGRCDDNGPVFAIKIWWGPLDNNDVPTNSFVTSYQP